MAHHGPAFATAPPDLVERFEAVTGVLEGVTIRTVFGYPAAFAGGHMFTGLFADQWFVRLGDLERAELEAVGGSAFEPMPGRPMREYVVLPAALATDPPRARPWVERALAQVQTLKPKAKG